MAPPKSRLGRGLGALISGGLKSEPSEKKRKDLPAADEGIGKTGTADGTGAPKAPTPADAPSSREALGYEEIPVSLVDPNPFQPRREFSAKQLTELAESIRSEGLLQPIVVRKIGARFQLIAGERRWRAFQLIGQQTIPARIITAGDYSSASMALIENLQRENLNPIEEATGYASLIRDFDLTQEKVAERVGKGRASVANSLRLLQLNVEIQGYLAKELLSAGHAKVLLGLETREEQILVARRVIEQGISVRETERLVLRSKKNRGRSSGGRGKVSDVEQTEISDLERRLGSHLNARVTLKHAPKKGRIQIEYQGNEDLQRILEKVGLRS
jgi:ParB family chromosome partitioning protein